MVSRIRGHLRGWRWSIRWAYTHPSNQGHRLRAALLLVWAKLYTRLTKNDLVVPYGERSRAIVTQRAPISERYAGARVTDWAQVSAWRSRLRPGDLFVDVGAHVGFYTLVLAEHGAQTVAVEPHPQVRAVLEENIRLNGIDVEVHGVALSNEPGLTRLSGVDLTQMHLSQDGIEVEVDTLDGILDGRTAAGVKIDVEGFERLVLEGAAEAMAEGRILGFQLEWGGQSQRHLGESRDATVTLLRSSGYEFFRPDPQGRLVDADPSTLGADIFAVLPGSGEAP